MADEAARVASAAAERAAAEATSASREAAKAEAHAEADLLVTRAIAAALEQADADEVHSPPAAHGRAAAPASPVSPAAKVAAAEAEAAGAEAETEAPVAVGAAASTAGLAVGAAAAVAASAACAPSASVSLLPWLPADSIAASAAHLEFTTLENAAAWAGALADQILVRADSCSLLRDGLGAGPAPSAVAGVAIGRGWEDGPAHRRADGQADATEHGLARVLRDNVEAMRAAVSGAIAQASREQAELMAQLARRGELLAQRESALAELELQQRRAAESKVLGRLVAAQKLVSRRALEAANRALLGQCWRALCLNVAASRLLADRKRFRALAQQQLAGGGAEFGATGSAGWPPQATRGQAVGRLLRAVD